MKKILLYFLFSFVAFNITAQEFNFTVSLNTQKASSTDPKVFESLELALKDFLNNQRWTEDDYEPEERIECNLQLTITQEVSATSFKADLTIQATRPVFNSDYQTALITYVDKNITFNYEAYQPLEFSENVFNSNLTAVLGFYVYIILGMDYDSFSLLGGEEHYQKAQNILNNIPPNVANVNKGWRALDGNVNRYWIIESILNPRTRPMRTAMYNYHRLALDIMSESIAEGRAIMASALKEIEKVNSSYPNSMVVRLFTLAKADEVVEIFKGGTRKEQNDAIRIMSKLDPSNASRYRKIRG